MLMTKKSSRDQAIGAGLLGYTFDAACGRDIVFTRGGYSIFIICCSMELAVRTVVTAIIMVKSKNTRDYRHDRLNNAEHITFQWSSGAFINR